VVALCHPEWRGIREATLAQGLPVVESAHPGRKASALLDTLEEVGTALVVVNGFPPGTGVFATAAAARGIRVRIVMHSSMAQHGFEKPESTVIEELCRLAGEGLVDVVGFSKEGQAEAFVAMGCPAVFVPPRISHVPATAPADLGAGRHVGIFAEATWRKNVTTQLGAVAMLRATAHVTALPDVPYLIDRVAVVDHGIVDRSSFLALLAGVDINLSVSLYESFPVLPQESYQLGTPCLVSRTSALFRSDPVLWDISTVSEHDNPRAVAAAAERLLESAARQGIVDRAVSWMEEWNTSTAPAWERFIDPERIGK
jgi:hypothetical protein